MNDDSHKHHDHEDDSDCLEAMDHIYAYLNGELADEETLHRIEHHLSHCKSCYSRAELEREINKRLKESSQEEIPNTLKSRLHDLMDDF